MLFRSLSAFYGLAIHAFFDGLTISAGMQFDFFIGLLMFIAILLHKFPEGLTIASIMLASYPEGEGKRKAFTASLVLGGATMVGIIVLLVLSSVDKNIVGVAFAISAGAASYVGASDLIPEINRSEKRITPLVVFGGMLLFYLSQRALEGIIR